MKPSVVAAFLIFGLATTPALALKKQAKEKEGAQQNQGPGESKVSAYEPNFPKKMNWMLSTVNGQPPAAEASMTIDDNLRGSGLSGCNTWSAALYPIRGQKLAMGPVAMTKKSCSKESMMLERQFLTVLHSGPTWKQEGYTLTVTSQAGTLVFQRGF